MDALLKSFVTEKMREIAKPEAVDMAANSSQDSDSGDVSDPGGKDSRHKKKKKKKDKKEKKEKYKKSKKSHKRESRSPSSSESDSDYKRYSSKKHTSKKPKSSKPEKSSNFYEDYEKVKEILDEYEPGEANSPEIKREPESYKRPGSNYYGEESLSYRKEARIKEEKYDRYSSRGPSSYRHESSHGRYQSSSRRRDESYSHGRYNNSSSRRRSSERRRSRSRSRHGRSRSKDNKKEIRTYILPQFNVNAFGQTPEVKPGKAGLGSSGGGTTTKTVEYNKPKTEQSVADFVKQCRMIAKDADDDDEPVNKPYVSDEDEDSPSEASRKKNPGFTVKPANILLNIPNSTQMSLPVYKPVSELRLEFPVASGEEHREHNENIAKGKIKEEDPQAERVFEEMPAQKPDINRAMKDKAMLTKLLDQNPYDTASLIKLHKVEKIIHQWSICAKEPGKFTGTTKVQCLSQRELEGDDPHNQTWARKDIFRRAKKLTSDSAGMGQVLLQKMGWCPGQPLGKRAQGNTEPIDLNFNLDRKGLCGTGESIGTGPVYGALAGLEGRHPISVLADTCRAKGWGNPYYEQVSESGPPHKRIFHFKVRVNNVDYVPHSGSASKKQAKADAAAGALFALGIS